MLNGPLGRTVNQVTDQKFGDSELYLEFMIAKGSNSGVYLHGLYEVQVFDSWDSTNRFSGDFKYALRPGEWQSFQIWFRGPSFDAAGKKTANARFLRVLHNGLSVQENVEVEGGTRAHMAIPEAAANPIMLQGDHGPVAYRHIYIRPLRPIIER